LIGLRKLALQLTLVGILAGLAATESRAQWGWTTPASPTPQAQAAPPPAASRGENFSAKPAAQLFASDCTGAGCHKGPQGLAKDRGAGSLASFLREHYTNSRESASALAAYLVGVPGAARADPKQQQPRAAARTDDAQKPAERKPPAAIPPAAVAAPSGETGEPAAKPAPAPTARAPRGRQAVAPAPQAAPPPAAPEPPPPPAAPPEPPKPQWDIFD
jgi:hypothetical protein